MCRIHPCICSTLRRVDAIDSAHGPLTRLSQWGATNSYIVATHRGCEDILRTELAFMVCSLRLWNQCGKEPNSFEEQRQPPPRYAPEALLRTLVTGTGVERQANCLARSPLRSRAARPDTSPHPRTRRSFSCPSRAP